MWPFDTLDVIWTHRWLRGAVESSWGAVVFTVGIVLIKKAQYQLMGPKVTEDDAPPKWSEFMKKRGFWVGFLLYILKDPINYFALRDANGSTVAGVDVCLSLLLNFLLSYVLLYEVASRSDILAMIACFLASVVMNEALGRSTPHHFGKVPVSFIQHMLDDVLYNVAFCIWAAVCVLVLLICLYVYGRVNVGRPFAICMMASLLTSGFSLVARVCITVFNLTVGDFRTQWNASIYNADSPQFVTFIVCLNAVLFILKSWVTLEGVRQLPCRFFIPAFLIGTEIVTQVQTIMFMHEWEGLGPNAISWFAVGCIAALGSICFISAHGDEVLPSPGADRIPVRLRAYSNMQTSLLHDPILVHRSVTAIMDEYGMRVPEAENPAPLKLVDMQPDKFAGRRQQFPLIMLSSIVLIPVYLYFTGHTYAAFCFSTAFCFMQGWKMGAFVPIFAYVGIRKMERYKNAHFKALYDAEQQQVDCPPNRSRPSWADLVHFVIIPNYAESLEDLCMTLESIAVSSIAKSNIGLILAMEKGEKGSDKKAEQIIEQFKDQFLFCEATFHPKVLTQAVHPSAEVGGKSANAQWSARRLLAAIQGSSKLKQRKNGTHADCGCFCVGLGSAAEPRHDSNLNAEEMKARREKAAEIEAEEAKQNEHFRRVLQSYGRELKMENVVLTVGDADSEFHPKYFEALSYHYLHAGGKEGETPQRHVTMWQPPIVHMKNYLDQPWPVRLASLCVSMHEIACLSDPNAMRVGYSTYSLSAILAAEMDGWDPDWITEDWHTSLKIFLTTGGRLRVAPIFLPILNSTPDVKNDKGEVDVKATIISRWAQAKRHALGISELVFLHEHMLRITNSMPSCGEKLKFAYKAFFMWFKLVWIHTYVAILPIFAPLNTLLLMYYNENQGQQMSSIDSWTYLLNCIFQVLGVVSAVLLFPISCYLFESQKPRINGIYEPGCDIFEPVYKDDLPWKYRNPILNWMTFSLESIVSLPAVSVMFAAVEWRAAWKTAFTKGGGFVYVSAAMGAANAAKKAETPK
eukprot:TRINITY_DN14487_c0_g3_i1.p1 TRINITY_DN14487_c0_g3~~TRINITY_DN14487_c0_g3_i1.p1  ORF type:complete len:1026 (-),score=134.06 TRINITY_DN14487_c0_g3_i1:91-3168(-)